MVLNSDTIGHQHGPRTTLLRKRCTFTATYVLHVYTDEATACHLGNPKYKFSNLLTTESEAVTLHFCSKDFAPPHHPTRHFLPLIL